MNNNNNRNIILIEGTVAGIDVIRNDATATSVSIYMRNEDTEIVTHKTASYVDGVATIEFSGIDTATPGVYPYQINETLSGGGLAKYGALDCDGDGNCEYGYIIICAAIDGGIS